MDAMLYAPVRQRELLSQADHLRLERLAEIARRCAEACRDDVERRPFVRRLLATLTGRRSEPVSC